MPSNPQEDEEKFTPWRVAELLFGSGVIIYAITSVVTAIWWTAATDNELKNIHDRQVQIEMRVDGLDNVALGNRITKLETQVTISTAQTASMENKIDQLLVRSRNQN